MAPNEVVNKLVLKKIRSMDRYILDGYPRRTDQAEMLGDSVDLVIFIDVDKDTCIHRICKRNHGRDDDEEEVGRKRYDVYTKETMPILELYKSYGKIVRVDGNGSPETIFSKICGIIE